MKNESYIISERQPPRCLAEKDVSYRGVWQGLAPTKTGFAWWTSDRLEVLGELQKSKKGR